MNQRTIVHIEIPAQNREVGAQFYADLFGWKVEHLTGPSPYTLLETGNVAVGMPNMGDMYQAGDVIVYVASDDVAADLKKIEELGGKKLSEPFAVGDFGMMAFFADPSGNRLALWKPNE